MNSDLYFGDFEHCNLNSLLKYTISNKNHEILNVKNSLNSHKIKTISSSLKFRILFEKGISKQNTVDFKPQRYMAPFNHVVQLYIATGKIQAQIIRNISVCLLSFIYLFLHFLIPQLDFIIMIGCNGFVCVLKLQGIDYSY